MTLDPINLKKICQALIEARLKYSDGTQKDFCTMMGINPSAFSQIKRALDQGSSLEGIINDNVLVRIGRALNVNFSSAPAWKIVSTETYEYVTPQLDHCKNNSVGRIFCDIADIGKSTVAKQFMLNNQNVFYLDCSQCKSRNEYMRALAKLVGVSSLGHLTEVYRNTVNMLLAMDKPLVIHDEWGDISYPAMLEIKSYWNATEGACGWYMMGAQGLKKKLNAGITGLKVGFEEIFRRMGGDYMSITGKMNAVEVVAFKKRQVMAMAQHNLPEGVDIKDVTDTLSLTRAKENIRKKGGK